MMLSIRPTPPHLASGPATPGVLDAPAAAPCSEAHAPPPLPSGATTPSDVLSYAGGIGGMEGLLPPFDVVPPPLDPALLQSAMVANHLRAARLRLLPELPYSFRGHGAANSMWSWWCRACGALPETWTRTEKGSPTGSGARTPKRKKRKSSLGKRTADGQVKDDADGFPEELKRSLGALVSGEPAGLPPARKPPSPVHRRRKPAACPSCGLPTIPSRAWPTIDLPPARTVAVTRAAAAAANAPPAQPSAPQTFFESPATSPGDAAGGQSTSPSPSVSAESSPAPMHFYQPIPCPPPTLWNTPSLQHIPTSCGDLPTYPRPPVVPPPGPAGSSVPIKIPPSGGHPLPAKKRKKKSGLAKLLAQNAQRESEGSSGLGNWGLG